MRCYPHSVAMTKLFHEGHRAVQDAFGTRPIADRLEEVNAHDVFTASDRAFIEASRMFFLATADADGRPNVSHKGGAQGFVRVVGPSVLAYPDYDGNGMFISLGNVSQNPYVGLLFIDLEKPRRLVVRGRASFSREDPLMPLTVGAQLIVRIAADFIYPNCPRYIHRYTMVGESDYTPRAGAEPIEPAWKAMPQFADAVHARQKVARGDKND
jgi:uncharacterized protein